MDFTSKIKAVNEKNSFMIHNFIKLEQMEQDRAVVTLDLRNESMNLFGTVHGGVFLTMADCAAGAAARSRGKRYVTLSNHFQFFRNTKSNHVRAISTIKNRGKTICVVAVDVLDEEDRLLAAGTFTMFTAGDPDPT